MAYPFDAAALMGGSTPSKYQEAIFNFVYERVNRLHKDNLIIEAVAGSGKTSTIVAAATLIPSNARAVFLAFNKKIADELKLKLPRHVEAMTLNSLGAKIWGQYVKGKRKGWPVLDERKTSKIMREVMTSAARDQFGAEVIFLVRMAKAYGVVPEGYQGAVNANGSADTPEFWNEIIEFYDRQIDEKHYDAVIDAVRTVLRATLDNETTIDYDDQLYLPVVKRTAYGTPIPHTFYFHAMFVDEAQDLNPVQRRMLNLIAHPKSSFLVAVGDRRQSIYGFRGAATDSMEKIEKEFNCKVLPLSISYRCAKMIVEHAQEVVGHIEAAPTAAQGEVVRLDDYRVSTFEPNDLIICRNNAPLVTFAFKLIANKVRCKVLGRDIGRGLIALIDRVAHENSVPKLVEEMTAWRDQQVATLRAQNDGEEDEAAERRVNDQYDSVMAFANNTAAKTVDGLKAEIEALFAEANEAQDAVILCTGHKSKGLEAGRVFHLNSDLLYPRWVKPGTWEYVQEQNLDYVMRTRAKASLFYINADRLAA